MTLLSTIRSASPASTTIIGNSSVGVNQTNIRDGFRWLIRAALPSTDGGTIDSIDVYMGGGGAAGSGTGRWRALVYRDVGGVPDTLLGTGTEVTFVFADAQTWRTSTLTTPPTIPSGDTHVWIGAHGGPSDNVGTYRYDTITNGQRWAADSYADGAADPSGATNLEAKAGSFRANFTASGVAPASLELDDAAGVADTMMNAHGIVLSIADGLVATDAIGVPFYYITDDPFSDAWIFSDPSGVVLTQAINDSASAADVTARAAQKSLADLIALTDAASSSAGKAQTTGDTIALSDAATSARGFDQLLSDPLAATDAASLALAMSRAVADTAGVSDALSAVSALARVTADGATATDALQTVWSVVLGLSDVLGLTDQATSATSGGLGLADSATIGDQFAQNMAKSLSLSDLANLSDAIGTPSAERVLSVADAVALVDSLATAAVTARGIADTAGITDARALASTRALTDAAAVTDSMATQIGGGVPRQATINDTLSATDVLVRQSVVQRVIADTVAAADQATTQLGVAMALTDSAALQDQIETATVLLRDLSDTLLAVDAALAGIGDLWPDLVVVIMNLAVTTLQIADAAVSNLVIDDRPATYAEIDD